MLMACTCNIYWELRSATFYFFACWNTFWTTRSGVKHMLLVLYSDIKLRFNSSKCRYMDTSYCHFFEKPINSSIIKKKLQFKPKMSQMLWKYIDKTNPSLLCPPHNWQSINPQGFLTFMAQNSFFVWKKKNSGRDVASGVHKSQQGSRSCRHTGEEIKAKVIGSYIFLKTLLEHVRIPPLHELGSNDVINEVFHVEFHLWGRFALFQFRL